MNTTYLMSAAHESAWLLLLKFLLPAVIAGVAAFIAYQQWKTNHYKVKLDLYDRRLKVYERFEKCVRYLADPASDKVKGFIEVLPDVSDTWFLFGKEVADYLEELRAHGEQLLLLRNRRPAPALDLTKGDIKEAALDLMEAVNAYYKENPDIDAERRWFRDQHARLHTLFGPYLDFSKLL